MWKRVTAADFPTPLPTEERRYGGRQTSLLDGGDVDPSPSSPQKRVHMSIYPLFDKYRPRHTSRDNRPIDRSQDWHRTRPSTPPATQPAKVKQLNHDFAALRVALHTNTVVDIENAREAMALKVDETIDQNIAKLSKIDNKLMQLTAPVSDCEIEAQIGGTDERQRTTTVLVRDAILKYDQTEHMFQEQLTRLWSSWIGSQLKIQKLQNDLQELCQHELSNGSNGISASNREWADHEDRDVGRRSKKVVEDMELCEEKFQEKLDEEAANVTQSFLIQ